MSISLARLHDLLHGRIDRFGLDALIDLAHRAGLRVRLDIDHAA